jgi:hypothetical protein
VVAPAGLRLLARVVRAMMCTPTGTYVAMSQGRGGARGPVEGQIVDWMGGGGGATPITFRHTRAGASVQHWGLLMGGMLYSRRALACVYWIAGWVGGSPSERLVQGHARASDMMALIIRSGAGAGLS